MSLHRNCVLVYYQIVNLDYFLHSAMKRETNGHSHLLGCPLKLSAPQAAHNNFNLAKIILFEVITKRTFNVGDNCKKKDKIYMSCLKSAMTNYRYVT